MFLTLSFTLRRASTGENNPNNEITIKKNRFAAENTFITHNRERSKLPTFAKEKDNLPISVLFEYVFGVKPDAQQNVIRWYIDLTDRIGIERYPFGRDATLSLLCEARGSAAEEPQVQIGSDRPVTVEIYWDGGRQFKTVTLTGNETPKNIGTAGVFSCRSSFHSLKTPFCAVLLAKYEIIS